jgi:Mor family transcriptional regulator
MKMHKYTKIRYNKETAKRNAEIYKLYRQGVTYLKIGEIYKLTKQRIYQIVMNYERILSRQ